MRTRGLRCTAIGATCALMGAGSIAVAGELIPGGPALGVDDRFVLTSGLDTPPSCLEVLDDGTGDRLYAAGSFVTADGVQVNGLARWDGERWEGVGDGSMFTLGGRRARFLEAMAYFDDGAGLKLYVGGYFDRVGDVEAKGVACWDGASWSGVGGGFELDGELGRVDVLTVFDDGESGPRLIAGGEFDASNGLPVLAIAELANGAWGPLPSENTLRILWRRPQLDIAIRDMRVFVDEGEPRLAVAFGDEGAAILEEETLIATGQVVAWDGVAWTALLSPSIDDGSLGGSFRGVLNANTLATNADGELFVAGKIACEEFHPLFEGSLVFSASVARWTGERWAASVVAGNEVVGDRVAVRRGDERDEFFITFREGNSPIYPPPNLHRSVQSSTFPELAFQVIETTDLLAGAYRFSDSRFTRGRRTRSEMTMFPSGPDMAPVVALGTFQQAPDRPATSVVQLIGQTWRTLGSGEMTGLGANSSMTDLVTLHDDGKPRLVASGWFSVIGQASGSPVASFESAAWSPIGMRGLAPGGSLAGLQSFVALPARDREALLLFRASRPTGGGDIVDAAQFVDGQWRPLTFAGEPVVRGGGVASATGTSSYLVIETNSAGQRVVRWNGEELADQFAPTASSSTALSVHEQESQELLFAFDRDAVSVWDGASLESVEAPGQPTFHFLRALEPFVIDGQPVTVVEGLVYVDDAQQERELAVLMFDGSAWSPAPILHDLAASGRLVNLIRPVRLRDRLWLLVEVRHEAFQSGGILHVSQFDPFLYDGDRLVPLGDFLAAPDGSVTDILSNPLPDGREEVILAGAFLRMNDMPSSRIGRVVLPAPADVNADGDVDGADLGLLLGAWGSDRVRFDLDFDGVVGAADLQILLAAMRGESAALD